MRTKHFSKRYTFARCEGFIQCPLGRSIGPCKSQVLKIFVMDQSVSTSKIFQRQRLSPIQDLGPSILGSWPLYKSPEPLVKSIDFLKSTEGEFISLGWTEAPKAMQSFCSSLGLLGISIVRTSGKHQDIQVSEATTKEHNQNAFPFNTF